MSESVDVLGESPLVDVSSSSTDNALNQDMLFNLPIRYGNVATTLLNYACPASTTSRPTAATPRRATRC